MINTILGERERQQRREDAIAAATLARKQKLKDRDWDRYYDSIKTMRKNVASEEAATTLYGRKIALEEKKAELNKLDPNSLKAQKLTAEINKLKAETEQVGVDEITPTEQIARDKLIKAEHDSIVFGSYKDDKGNDVKVSFERRKAYAIQANNRPNNYIYYFITEPQEVEGWFAKDIPGIIKPIYLDRGPNGEQITSQHIIDTAKAEGITEEEVLKIIGEI